MADKAFFNNTAQALIDATRAGRVVWVPIERPNVYRTETRSGAFEVESASDGAHPFALRILDEQGSTLEWISSTPGNVYFDWETRLEMLHTVARRSALQVDKVINDLIAELDLDMPDLPLEDDI